MAVAGGSFQHWVDKLWTFFFGHQAASAQPLESNEPLPLTVESITSAWLSKVLGVPISSVQVREVIHGSGSKVLVELTYSKSFASLKTLPPARLCVKGGFNPQLLEMLPALFAVYRLEAQFYHHIAPRISGLKLVPAYWCGVDQPSGKGQGIVILEDVTTRHFTFGDPLHTWPVERVRAALCQLARLHAATWGAKQADFPWVPREFGLRDVIVGMMSPENWSLRFDDPAIRPPVAEIFWRDRRRVVRCLQTLWASSSNQMTCMVHGDTQVGNTFIDADGQPGFLDWQCIHVNSAAHDVTYFMTGALTIEDRRLHERELFGFYLEELCRAGGPNFTLQDVWDEYRMFQMQGFAWALAGPMMQPKVVVDAISQRHCAAILDHQSMDLLDALADSTTIKV
ncbi:kinase-like domain-containing protein [Coniella lustricola]|uniref:Kinase-like domain-containing protein n=1 Tax=Coniella lustricola TaxID=2025994 RepID=A0A2T3ABZ8_9PEZI|nr:kinase-like domain-containing protein [Coniella lustricola]